MRIGTSLDVTRTAEELADVRVPVLADFVSVDLLEPYRLASVTGSLTTSPAVNVARLSSQQTIRAELSLLPEV
ncbi:hypothetical protein ACIOTI_37875 [Streptomyces sp. NPDC087843]|uniref:hypothetical protein n=1 Tax=Streptomyces sp. NPDC087843 TaxID=3365804 RepID=UPI00380D3AA3